MKRILKGLGIGLGSLLAIIAIVVLALHLIGTNRLNNAPSVAVRPVRVDSSAETLARGEHLVLAVSECVGCHTENLAGQIIIDEPPIGRIVAPNLTSGRGGIGATYSDEDWERAIRHGVAKDGRTIAIMPSMYYASLSDEDLGAIIAYVKSVAPVDNELPARAIAFPGTIIFGLLAYGDLPVARIDHANVGMGKPAEGVTPEYGAYLVNIAACRECHGDDLAGRTDSNGPPPGPNLTRGAALATWNEHDFLTTIRTGQTPTGRQLSNDMPWRGYGGMTDDELRAIWLYLQSLPARVASSS